MRNGDTYLAEIGVAVDRVGSDAVGIGRQDRLVAFDGVGAVAELDNVPLFAVRVHQVAHALERVASDDLCRHQLVRIVSRPAGAQQPAIRIAFLILFLQRRRNNY